jgi:hypothetical protein
MPPKSEQTEKPGADRFWGQFSQSRAGRSDTGETGPDTAPDEEANPGHGESCLEWCPICRSAELFRNTVSPELRQQAESIQHEAIGVLKAFLDAYVDKTGEQGSSPRNPRPPEPEQPPSPRDIPLE